MRTAVWLAMTFFVNSQVELKDVSLSVIMLIAISAVLCVIQDLREATK